MASARTNFLTWLAQQPVKITSSGAAKERLTAELGVENQAEAVWTQMVQDGDVEAIGQNKYRLASNGD